MEKAYDRINGRKKYLSSKQEKIMIKLMQSQLESNMKTKVMKKINNLPVQTFKECTVE